MHQIEILLPAEEKFAAQRKALAHDLASRFGGLTAFTRAPAKGIFEQNGKQVKDDIVVGDDGHTGSEMVVGSA